LKLPSLFLQQRGLRRFPLVVGTAQVLVGERRRQSSPRRALQEAELEKVKAYLSGRLELRLDESRYLASWVGTQEALHDRVWTPDEALEAIRAVAAEDVQALAGSLFRDDLLRLAVVAPAGKGRNLERTLRIAGPR